MSLLCCDKDLPALPPTECPGHSDNLETYCIAYGHSSKGEAPEYVRIFSVEFEEAQPHALFIDDVLTWRMIGRHPETNRLEARRYFVLLDNASPAELSLLGHTIRHRPPGSICPYEVEMIRDELRQVNEYRRCTQNQPV